MIIKSYQKCYLVLSNQKYFPEKYLTYLLFYYFCKHERETENIHIDSYGLLLYIGNASTGSEECFFGFHSEGIFT